MQAEGLGLLGGVGAIPVVGEVVLGLVAIIGIIGGILELFGGGGTAQVEKQVQALQTAVAQGLQQVAAFAWAVATAFGALLQWIHDAFITLVQTIWDLLKKLAALVKNLMVKIIPEILGIIRKMRDFLNQVYVKYIRVILIWLQYLRQWLVLLKIFHIGWATKLDQWLGRLQGFIVTPFFYILRSINGIGTWINLIITAGGLIQRAVFINSMYAYQSDWIPMWWTGQTNNFVGAPLPATPPAFVAPTQAQVTADVQLYVSTQSGPLASYVQLALQAAQNNAPDVPLYT